MAKLTVIDVSGAPQRIVGRLQRLMLEIRPGTFVGRLPPRTVKEVWSEVTASDCSAIVVTEAHNEAGFRVGSHGKSARMPVDNFGIQLIEYSRKTRKKSV